MVYHIKNFITSNDDGISNPAWCKYMNLECCYMWHAQTYSNICLQLPS